MPMKIQEKYSMCSGAACFSFFWLFFSSCGSPAHNADGAPIADSSIRNGKELAMKYCVSCHQLPDPGLLDKASWQKGVLPGMGPRLGIFGYKGVRYPSFANDPHVGRGFYPSAPLMAGWQWQEIIDYYTGTAPDSIPPQPEHLPVEMGLKLFKAMAPGEGGGEAGSVKAGAAGSDEAGASKAGTAGARPLTSYVRVDSSGGRRQIIAGTLFPGMLWRYDEQLRLTDSVGLHGGIVDAQWAGDSGIVCNIGNINPNDQLLGTVNRVSYDGKGRLRLDTVPVLAELARPVQATEADLNGDGRKDLLVCEFGNQKGELAWWEKDLNGKYIRHVLRAQPGAIKAYIRDADGDGRPDIWALFAQGDEGIFLYLNKGGGRFEERRVLSFPPEYGSSYFELADFNKDGHPDIVYTCGDNADYSVVPKPFHGVYIYMNDGTNRFTQSYFYPINGCYKAMARDFDGDGDLDIATIAYFADFGKHPEEGFVYLQSEGGMQFKPLTLPEGEAGRWLAMDAGDLDGDGKIDLVLGNFSMGPSLSKGKRDWKKAPAILFLKNVGR